MKLLFTTLITTAALALSGCHTGGRLTKANVDEVSEGMSKKQVESILGPPSAIDTTDLILLKKTTYTYRQGAGYGDGRFQRRQSAIEREHAYAIACLWIRRARAYRPSWSEKWTKRSGVIRPIENAAPPCRSCICGRNSLVSSTMTA